MGSVLVFDAGFAEGYVWHSSVGGHKTEGERTYRSSWRVAGASVFSERFAIESTPRRVSLGPLHVPQQRFAFCLGSLRFSAERTFFASDRNGLCPRFQLAEPAAATDTQVGRKRIENVGCIAIGGRGGCRKPISRVGEKDHVEITCFWNKCCCDVNHYPMLMSTMNFIPVGAVV